MTLASHQFDLLISGGGMTGALLALVVKKRQPYFKIGIIEQSALGAATAPTVSFDSRSIALSAASVELLNHYGLWQVLKPHACAIEYIQVSDRGHFGKTRLKASEHGRTALGYVIEIEWLGALFYQELAKLDIHWFRPLTIQSIAKPTDPNWRHVLLSNNQQLSARLLVLAEGGDAPGRSLAGIDCQQTDYQQTALIANIGIAESHQQQAFERFTSDGPLALLPLTRQRYSLVWTLPAARAAELKALTESEFLAKLQHAFGYRAGVFQSAGNRICYPLMLKRATQATAHRLLLIGNSLHNLHPIAGQGFNLALRDIAALEQLIGNVQRIDGVADCGSYALTRQYQDCRSADMAEVIMLTDALVRLFSNQSKLMAFGRSLALSKLNHCPLLKSLLAEQSMGLAPLARQQQQIAEFAANVTAAATISG